MKTPKRVVMISFDAMGADDIPFMCTLPNFAKFWEHAATCTNVSSVYPSLTYPAHTSIITGRKPINHGIINNTRLQPGLATPDWFWQRKYVKGTTLYDELIKKGWSTAALLWPVTAKSKIRYNIPEVLANRPWQNQITVSASNSSLGYLLKMNRLFGHLRDGIHQPALDNFVHATALHTIEKYNPDFFMIHLTDLDTQRHIYGVHHQKCQEAMLRHDARLGQIMDALERTGSMEETTVVILGDHFQKNTSQIVYFNYLLKEQGYLVTEGDRIKEYRVVAKDCDGSCYIYLHPDVRDDTALKKEVQAFFEALATEEAYGIARIFSSEEAGELGADHTCFLMLEAAEGFYFLSEFEKKTGTVKEEKKHKMRATHGYLPKQADYKTFFAAKGCGIMPDVTIPEMELYDEGVTLAALLGCDLGEVDGTIMVEMLDH